MKKLKTLEESNAEAFRANHHNFNHPWGQPCLNGIACPKCGEELYDSQPQITLTSNPAQKTTMCKSCDYTGYRYC